MNEPPSRKQLAQYECQVRNFLCGEGAVFDTLYAFIAPLLGKRLAVDLDAPLRHIDDPYLANAVRRIAWDFRASVITEGAIGNLDEQEHLIISACLGPIGGISINSPSMSSTRSSSPKIPASTMR